LLLAGDTSRRLHQCGVYCGIGGGREWR